jgi:hypothetical protein
MLLLRLKISHRETRGKKNCSFIIASKRWNIPLQIMMEFKAKARRDNERVQLSSLGIVSAASRSVVKNKVSGNAGRRARKMSSLSKTSVHEALAFHPRLRPVEKNSDLRERGMTAQPNHTHSKDCNAPPATSPSSPCGFPASIACAETSCLPNPIGWRHWNGCSKNRSKALDALWRGTVDLLVSHEAPI